ncbi:hypothetical protein F2Q70_00003292 [Brassica cretica]|uniref:Uncharacterized protein n=2 Tax=Brassica cretica TaxID=69181 RepID=A0A8S9IMC1_BRACR|nr:hypothetical protein F2Q68_00020827 [Brassica cretica]KAF2571310.1 hypothetical protein F2Q70_00003292 [Brassica cretica]KAF3504220.1 hypothetical protein F2Q69_00042552 [Brassica cretica]KAF3567960.1 hypothetical protein DY000_02015042 [Brassica cretica]
MYKSSPPRRDRISKPWYPPPPFGIGPAVIVGIYSHEKLVTMVVSSIFQDSIGP